jgi:hypothetical protein
MPLPSPEEEVPIGVAQFVVMSRAQSACAPILEQSWVHSDYDSIPHTRHVRYDRHGVSSTVRKQPEKRLEILEIIQVAPDVPAD